MARVFLSLCGAVALTFATASAQVLSLVGTWSATVNWMPSGIMIGEKLADIVRDGMRMAA